MASFKTHLSFGAVVGIGVAAICLSYSLLSDNIYLFWLFSAVFVGAILPDLDSDGGTPLTILFMVNAGIGACMSLLYLFQQNIQDWRWLIGIPIGAFIFIRYFMAEIFKKFTNHRGMFHSIPALFIVMLTFFMLLKQFELKSQDKIIISLALGLGFLSHLILDEIKSTVGFHGLIYHPKKSLGTALKFFSHSKSANLIAYGLLALLCYINIPAILETLRLMKSITQ